MKMSIEAMKQALEFIIANPPDTRTTRMRRLQDREDTITALRAAIAEQEKAEPVAWAAQIGGFAAHIEWGKRTDDNIHNTPLYTHPAPIPDGWQPIETAPKDGGVILLGLPAIGTLKDADQRRVYEGLWSDMQMRFTSVNGFIVLDCATYWMPLPAAPKGEMK